MTVIISGDNGVSDVDGSAGTPAIRGTDANTGIFFGADQVGVATNGVERVEFGNSETVFNDGGANVDFRVEDDTDANLLFVDASADRIGIGTSSPAAALDVQTGTYNTGYAVFGKANEGGRILFRRGFTGGAVAGTLGFDSATGLNFGLDGATDLFFNAGGTERARITSGGYFKASNTGSYTDQNGSYHELTQSANNPAVDIRSTSVSQTNNVTNIECTRNTSNGTYSFIACARTGIAYVFRVFDSGNVVNTNNSYGSISDVKLKQDIVDAGSQWNDIKNLRVRKFRWQSDPDGFLQIGLVAQEAEQVSPGLVDESLDYEEVEVTDEEGNVTTERQATGTTTKAVKYSILYMKAVKALQEAMERIETLEAKVAALEAR